MSPSWGLSTSNRNWLEKLSYTISWSSWSRKSLVEQGVPSSATSKLKINCNRVQLEAYSLSAETDWSRWADHLEVQIGRILSVFHGWWMNFPWLNLAPQLHYNHFYSMEWTIVTFSKSWLYFSCSQQYNSIHSWAILSFNFPLYRVRRTSCFFFPDKGVLVIFWGKYVCIWNGSGNSTSTTSSSVNSQFIEHLIIHKYNLHCGQTPTSFFALFMFYQVLHQPTHKQALS